MARSLSARRAWIEILRYGRSAIAFKSLSARRAWIEIRWGMQSPGGWCVALRKESVDRNSWCKDGRIDTAEVALRKESVDRNRALCSQFWA